MEQMNIVNEIKITYTRKGNSVKKITSSKIAYRCFKAHFDVGEMDLRESVYALYLDNGNKVLGIIKISDGSVNQSLFNIRMVLQGALLTNSTGVIIAHNHPSGNMKPSDQDIEVTNKLKKACDLMAIKVLDHLIVTSEGYFSFGDEGLI